MIKSEINVESINNRYSELAESCCSLSCGGAVDLIEIKKGDICLDLGSGRGNDVITMAMKTGTDGHAYGIDVSDGMLRKARKNAEKMNISNVSFLKSNLDNIILEDNSIDVIISNCTLNHVADKKRIWSEIFRIMKKGAHFIISDIYSLKDVPLEFRDDPQAVSECWAGSVTREEYLKNIYGAGFDNIEIIEESEPYDKGEIKVASWTLAGVKYNYEKMTKRF